MIRDFTSDVNFLVRKDMHLGIDRTRRKEKSTVCRKDTFGNKKKFRHRRIKRMGGTITTTIRLSPKVRNKLCMRVEIKKKRDKREHPKFRRGREIKKGSDCCVVDLKQYL